MSEYDAYLKHLQELRAEINYLKLENGQLRIDVVELKHAIETHRYWAEYNYTPDELQCVIFDKADIDLWNRGDAVKIENKTKYSP